MNDRPERKPRPASGWQHWAALFVCALASQALGACEGGCEDAASAPTPKAKPARHNVLLITMDTLRADALGSYGQAGNPTPHMDALAARSILFEQAFATAPFTGPSHASMLTGQHPSKHGVIYNGHRVARTIAERAPMLPELLQAQGYQTAALISSVVLDKRYGFGRGFEHFAMVCPSRHGDIGSDGVCVADTALAFLKHRDPSQPFFLWLHFIDPHFPYVVSGAVQAERGLSPGEQVPSPLDNAKARTPAELRKAYLADVFEADKHLGRVLAGLDGAGLWEETVVALVADHGEFMGERGLYEHFDTYDEVLRVPMMLAVPGVKAERRTGLVSIIDLLPSVLAALDLEVPAGVQGQNLLPSDGPAYGRPVFAEWRHFRVVTGQDSEPGDFLLMARTETDKLVLDLQYPKAGSRYFDLKADPGERDNRLAQAPPRVAELEAVLAKHRAEDVDPELLKPTRIELSDQDKAMLRSLGYAE